MTTTLYHILDDEASLHRMTGSKSTLLTVPTEVTSSFSVLPPPFQKGNSGTEVE